ncbi:Transcription initiation factor TFIID subunit 2-like protein [Drosera capensis]
MRMGFSYNKRKNLAELAAFRECTAVSVMIVPGLGGNSDSLNREIDSGWPGMMTIKVHELDGTHDHLLPMSGDAWQLLEIKCHSRLTTKRFQKPKKSSKPDGSDDNGDAPGQFDIRTSAESPLLWLRADPLMEYLAEIHFNQPVQMWINQLEKDKDVVAQAQAIEVLELLSNIPFAVVNALSNFISDTKAFWRVRIEAAFALARAASEETDWAGMLHLMKFCKSKRFDATIGLPKPNDFHDFAEYFVLEAIPQAIATVRTTDNKSPREAVELVLQFLKSNDNSGNPYSDVFWLAALVDAAGELEFGQQSIPLLRSLLKRVDRILQFERLMPSYNGALAISCIRTLTRIATKFSEYIPFEHATELIKPFLFNLSWEIRVEARRSLLDLQFHFHGINAALLMFIQLLEDDTSLRGQAKLGLHMTRVCQIKSGSGYEDEVKSQTLVALLRLLEGPVAFCNVLLRHHIFCILQLLAGRQPTLYGIPRDQMQHMGFPQICSEQRNDFDRPLELSGDTNSHVSIVDVEAPKEPDLVSHGSTLVPEAPKEPDLVSYGSTLLPEAPKEIDNSHGSVPHPAAPLEQENAGHEAPKEPDTVSTSDGCRLPVVKIRLKQPTISGRAGEADSITAGKTSGARNEIDLTTTSSVSVDAPERILAETMSISNQNLEEVNSSIPHASQTSASVGSAKHARDGGGGKELQCTADSSNIVADEVNGGALSRESPLGHGERKGKKKEKRRKREDDKEQHKDSPEYLERKRLKKERKQMEKERKLKLGNSSAELLHKMDGELTISTGVTDPAVISSKSGVGFTGAEQAPQQPSVTLASDVSSGRKLKIKIKNRTIDKL